jgi:acyl-CoA thioester hydrolase
LFFNLVTSEFPTLAAQYARTPRNPTSRLNFDCAALRCHFVNQATFIHQHRVTYADCTVGNHVYYARYLDLLEAARGEFFRSLGSPLLKWQEAGFMFPVVEAHLRYKMLARYDDLLSIQVWVTTAERVRLNFGYCITNPSGELVLEGETLHVCMSLEEKMKRLPEEFIAAVRPYLR